MNKEKVDLRVIATDVLHSFPAGLIADIQDSPVMIEGDPDHLQRVLSNLIENALRYTPAGGSVKVSVCSDGRWAFLKVADTGEGIAPQDLPHVTERFYRADAARARADGGAGLGLASCKTIAEAHGGSLAIESTLGTGTNVTIRLPSL
jgi:signal transduction histidine kinase